MCHCWSRFLLFSPTTRPNGTTSLKWQPRLIEGMAQSNVDYAVMNKLLQEGPSPSFEGMPVEEVPALTPPADAGIEVITDTRILDYRPLNVGSGGALADRSWLYLYRRIRLQKQEPTANQLRDPDSTADRSAQRPRPER